MNHRFSVFEYMYRDGGNFKTYGALLLSGGASGARERLTACLESGDLFVAEQIGVSSLCPKHWEDCGDGPSDLDHAYHEFVDLRPATAEDQATLPMVASLEALITRFRLAAGRWDVSLSPNCYL